MNRLRMAEMVYYIRVFTISGFIYNRVNRTTFYTVVRSMFLYQEFDHCIQGSL